MNAGQEKAKYAVQWPRPLLIFFYLLIPPPPPRRRYARAQQKQNTALHTFQLVHNTRSTTASNKNATKSESIGGMQLSSGGSCGLIDIQMPTLWLMGPASTDE